MRLAAPLQLDPRSPLAGANPIATLSAGALLMLVLFVSTDLVTAGVVLAALVASMPALRVPARSIAARAWPLVAAGVVVGVLNALLAPGAGGVVLFDAAGARITSENAVLGLALGLRLVGIGLAGVLAMATVDATDLADALVQQLGASPRFAVGALAAFRLMPVLAGEWQTIGLARRARGVEAGRSPVAAVTLFAGRLHALLVSAIRRGSRLAMAMDARGFGSLPCRSVARRQRMRPADWGFVIGAAGVGAGAVIISAAVDSWRFLLS